MNLICSTDQKVVAGGWNSPSTRQFRSFQGNTSNTKKYPLKNIFLHVSFLFGIGIAG